MGDYASGQPMEEILASIKRIIAEEDGPPSTAGLRDGAGDGHGDGEPPVDEDVLELGDAHGPVSIEKAVVSHGEAVSDTIESAWGSVGAAEEPAAEASATPEPIAESSPGPAPIPEPAPIPAFVAVAPEPDPPLLTGAAEQATRRAFASLSGLTVDSQAGPNTLEGLVRDLLRPILSEWLEASLPQIVERLVEREITRLGGR